VARGEVVIAERVDRTKAGDKSVDLPCTGVFEMEEGRIKVWRDYFDLGTYMRALG
jgi:limonene-1,2-epoxide hydrolase